MRGTTEATPLPEVFRDIHFDRADGILSVQAAGRKTEVYFDRGSVFYCKTDAADQRLDHVLVKWGLVTPAKVAALIQSAGQDVRGALVREGIFPDAKAFDDFMGQVLRERLMDVFALPHAEFAFAAQDVRELHRLAFPTSTPDIILEGVRRLVADSARFAPLVDDRTSLLKNDRPSVAVESLHMSPVEGYVLSQVSGTTSVADIAAVSPLGPEQTVRFLYALLVLDIVRHPDSAGYRFSIGDLTERAASSRSRDATDRESIEAEYQRVRTAGLLNVVPDGDRLRPDDLRAALKAYQEQWSPERFSDRVAKEMRDRLLIIAGRAGEALLASMEAARRQRVLEPEETGEAVAGEPGDDAFRLKRMEFSKTETQARIEADVQMAQEHFKRAQDALRMKDFHRAVQFAREAIRLNETSEAQALLADALVENPRWRKKAEEAYLRAMKLGPFNEHLPLALGRLYARAGLKDRAREQFERALEIQKDFDEARVALKQLKSS